MAWSSPRTWTTGELVTAAMLNTDVRDNLNFLAGWGTGYNSDSRTFTNTSFLDLDALTGGAGSMAAVTTTVTTGTEALVLINRLNLPTRPAALLLMSLSKSPGRQRLLGRPLMLCQHESSAANDLDQCSYTQVEAALNAGSNTFELQASASAGTGDIRRPKLIVIPLV